MTGAVRIDEDGADVLIRVKAVPGASRNQIAGAVGDRLKVRVSAPPEGGKANKAICKLIAQALGVKTNAVTVESGKTNPEKVVRVLGADRSMIAAALRFPSLPGRG